MCTLTLCLKGSWDLDITYIPPQGTLGDTGGQDYIVEFGTGRSLPPEVCDLFWSTLLPHGQIVVLGA